MYDEYPMIHYEFGSSGIPFALEAADEEAIPENEKNAYTLVRNAEYNLRGYVDVLTFFPQPDDFFRRQIHLQSFSHMYSLSDYFTSRDNTDSYLIVRTESGSGRLEYRDRSWILEPGDLFWISCQEKSIYRTEGEFWEHTDIHVNGEAAGPLYQSFAVRETPVVKSGELSSFDSDLRAVLDACVTMDAHRTLRTCHAIETMLVHMISADQGKQNTQTPRLQKLLAYMYEHYRDPLTIEDLARISGFSKYHFSREFKKMTGLPPNEYLIQLRLQQAKALLANTDLAVSRIAFMVGIENEAYFSRLFHQRTAMTPAGYRRQNRIV